MKLGLRHAGIVTLLMSAIASLYAAELEMAATQISGAAERWGLWAVVALLLVGAAGWALYKQTMFIQGTLVALVAQSIDSNRELRDALRHAPCGKTIPDSDGDPTPEPTMEIPSAIIRRRERLEKGTK